MGIAYRLLFFCFVVCFLFTGHASGQKFSVGAKAGPLITWANFGDKDDKNEFTHEVKTGFYGAALVAFPLKNNFSVVTEFGVSQKGRVIKFNDDTWENKATYYFADGAMLLRRSFPLNLGPNIPSRWFINIGPHISYWIAGKGKVTAGGAYNYTIVFEPMPETPSEPDFNKMYITNENRWLFGIDFGIGFTAPLRHQKNLVTEFRFTSGHTFFGTTSSASNRTLGFTDNLRSNEKVASITLAYTLDVNIQDNRKGKSTKDKEMNRKQPRRLR